MGRKVVIIADVPQIGYDVPSMLLVAQRTGRDLNKISPTLNEYFDRNKIVASVITSLAGNQNVQIVEPWKALCKENNCLVVIKGQSLYHDSSHLSSFGAHYISYIFDPVFESLYVK